MNHQSSESGNGKTMELAVHGKQMDVGDSLRGHVQTKLEDISAKYFNHTTYATVTFSREGHGHQLTRANIIIKVGKNMLVVADGKEADPRMAFDSAADKAAKQLRRYKRRLRDHHERTEREPEVEFYKARDYTLATDQDNEQEVAEDTPVVIAEMDTHIQTMTVSDAVMRLDLSGQPALLFSNASHGRINMVYRREDGNIGWVDPENEKAAVPKKTK
jgi:ribosomal subunit interface protein